ncbi:MAG: hypothetical protein B7X06_04160, partial [Verrucomicrobia bacterium 21-51-4]
MLDQLRDAQENELNQGLRAQKAKADFAKGALKDLETKLTTDFTGALKGLGSQDSLYRRQVKLDDPETTVLDVSARAKTPTGHYSAQVIRLANATVLNGQANIAASINSTDVTTDVSSADGPSLSQLGIRDGAITLQGQRIAVSTTDTLKDLFTKISTATSGDIVATYSTGTDKVTFTSQSGANIVLNSANDTNLFKVFQMLSGGSTVTCSSKIGFVNTGDPMATSTLKGIGSVSATGSFTINGQTITYDKTQ